MQLDWSTLGGRDCLVLRGGDLHEVGVVPARLAGRGLQPMAGSFTRDGDALCFVPRFGFVAGETYAVTRGGAGEAVATIERPAYVAAPTTHVLAIHPSSACVPLNLLRVYVTFSAPMSEGLAAQAIRMRDAAGGEELPGTFAPMDPELWDGAHRRLTVHLDPARIKRGLAPHREAGYPLRDGGEVIFEVGAGMRDAQGHPLRDAATRRWRVGPALRSRVDPRAWHLRPPRAGTRDPLRVEFDRPLDHALLQRCLHVAGRRGEAIRAPGEAAWDFVPAQPWDDTPQQLVIDAALEDVAGNAVSHVFDRDLDDPRDDPLDAARVTVDFRCA